MVPHGLQHSSFRCFSVPRVLLGTFFYDRRGQAQQDAQVVVAIRPQKHRRAELEMEGVCGLNCREPSEGGAVMQGRSTATIPAGMESEAMTHLGHQALCGIQMPGPMPKEHPAKSPFPQPSLMAYVRPANVISDLACKLRNVLHDVRCPRVGTHRGVGMDRGCHIGGVVRCNGCSLWHLPQASRAQLCSLCVAHTLLSDHASLLVCQRQQRFL